LREGVIDAEQEAEERSKSETVAILLVAHFPDVLARLSKLANSILRVGRDDFGSACT
jgi:hypothetical protein